MNNNKGKNRDGIWFMLVGFFMGWVMFWTLFPKEGDALYYCYTIGCILFAVGAVAFLSVYLINTFLMPYLNRRKAAMMALGREGIKIVRKDDTAKLAYKGIFELMGGRYAKAEDLLQQALARSDIRQNQMFCIEWLIRLYSAMENDSKLLWCYRKAVEFAPDNPEAQSRLGQEYLSKGKLDQATYCFEQALRYDPNDGFCYYSLSMIHMIRGEDDKAFEVLQKLLKINEEHPLCHSQLASYYALKGDAEMAETECKKAQLCGIKDPDEINRRINAMLSFHNTEYGGDDLPRNYYRKIERPSDNENDKSAESV